MPAGFLTNTGVVPGLLWGGTVAMIWVSELMVKLVPVGPKETRSAKLKSVPLMATWVPPEVLPLIGRTPVTVGTDMHKRSVRVSSRLLGST